MNVIHELDEAQIAQLHGLFQREWWTKGRTLEETRAGVEGSQVCIGLVDDAGLLQGFARVLTDGIFKALIFDVIVAEASRGRGLGDRLLELIRDHERLRRVRHFELYCLPGMTGFYEKHGFRGDVGGVLLMRRSGSC